MEAFVQQKQPGESDEEVEYSSRVPRQSSSSNDIITYSDVAFAAWGPMGRMVVDSSLVCAQVLRARKASVAAHALKERGASCLNQTYLES